MNKHILGIGLLVFIAVYFTSCSTTQPKTEHTDKVYGPNEYKADEALRHMSQKYDREFIGISINNTTDENIKILSCYAQGDDPNEDACSVYIIDTNNKIEYKDTYFERIIRNEVETRIQEICTDIGIKSKCIKSMRPNIYVDQYDHTKTYKDLEESGDTRPLNLRIICEYEESQVTIKINKQICLALEEEGFTGTINIYFVTPESFDLIDRTNIKETLISNEENVVARYLEYIKTP